MAFAKGQQHRPEDNDKPECVEIDPSGRYRRYQKILGKGALKTVYWAFDELEGMEVAWSQVKLRDVFKIYGVLERLKSEIYFLKTLNHKNIIKFYHYWTDNSTNTINIITELFPSGTLRQYRKRHGHVDIRAIKKWARQILEGLLFLHSHDPPIIHRDLKCDNIFVNGSQGVVKIGDLGLASLFRPSHSRCQSVIGTPEFMAPELYKEQYNELVDIYSFGMCLLEMTTFEYPYSECANVAQIYKKVTLGVKPAALEKITDPDLRQFVEKCLDTASRRLTARELLMDPFLQQSDCNQTVNDDGLVICPSLPTMEAQESDKLATYPADAEENAGANPEMNSVENARTQAVLSPSEMDRKGKAMRLTVVNNDLLSKSYEGGLLTTHEQEPTSRDFRVKGKLRDDHTVYLRLRIADSKGYVSNIHFPFNLEADTAIIVASEMVAELELSDQDVTRIADRIDAELVTLVPGWKPGAQFEDSPNSQNQRRLSSSSDGPSDDDFLMKSYVIQRLPSGRRYWLDVPKNSWSRKFINDAFSKLPQEEMKGVSNNVQMNDINGHLPFIQEQGDLSRPELVKSTVVAEVMNHYPDPQGTTEGNYHHGTWGEFNRTPKIHESATSASPRSTHGCPQDDRFIEQQLEWLEFQHRQELEAVRLKHEKALQELKSIFRQRSFTFSSRDDPRASFESKISSKSDPVMLSYQDINRSRDRTQLSYENSWNSAGSGQRHVSSEARPSYENSWNSGEIGHRHLSSEVQQALTTSPSSLSFSLAGAYDMSPELTSFRSIEQTSPNFWAYTKGYDSDPGADQGTLLNSKMQGLSVKDQKQHATAVNNKKPGTEQSPKYFSGNLLINSLKNALDSSSLGDLFKRDKGTTEAFKDDRSESNRYVNDGCLPVLRGSDKRNKSSSILFEQEASLSKTSKRRSKKGSKKGKPLQEKSFFKLKPSLDKMSEDSSQTFLNKASSDFIPTRKGHKAKKIVSGLFRSHK